MKSISFADIANEIIYLRRENERLKEEHKNMDETSNEVISEYAKLEKTNERMLNDLVKYEKEIQFLKQRNKELRQKTWYQVFEENLKLAEEIKQYQATLQAVETFIARFQNERR